MRLKDWTEKNFIRQVMGDFAITAQPDNFDDAVIVDLSRVTANPDAPFLVYSIDQPSFVRSADPAVDPFRFYGRWVAGVTCNDVIAMGAQCRGFSLALGAPPELETEQVQSLLRGIVDVLSHCGAAYEGGNLDSGELATVGFAWGIVPRHGIIRRSGARPGDAIVVTGELGLGWLDFQLRKHKLEDQVRPADLQIMRRYKELPVGSAAAIAAVADQGLFSSGMDLSDGLIEYFYTLVDRSGMGCLIDLAELPVSRVTRRNLRRLLPVLPDAVDVLERYPELIAFEPGYDSPLRHGFTVPANEVTTAERICLQNGCALRVIGRVTAEPAVLLDYGDGRQDEIPRFWDDQLRQEDTAAAWTRFLHAFR